MGLSKKCQHFVCIAPPHADRSLSLSLCLFRTCVCLCVWYGINRPWCLPPSSVTVDSSDELWPSVKLCYSPSQCLCLPINCYVFILYYVQGRPKTCLPVFSIADLRAAGGISEYLSWRSNVVVEIGVFQFGGGHFVFLCFGLFFGVVILL